MVELSLDPSIFVLLLLLLFVCFVLFSFGDWHENIKPLLVILTIYQTPPPSGSLPKWSQEFPPPSDCHGVHKSIRGFRSHLLSGEFSSVWCTEARRPGLFRVRLWDKCFQVGTMELGGGKDAGEWRKDLWQWSVPYLCSKQVLSLKSYVDLWDSPFLPFHSDNWAWPHSLQEGCLYFLA